MNSADNPTPRWLLPLVLALHAAVGAALLHAAAPLVKPALRSLEVALLAPPAAAPTHAAAPASAPRRTPQPTSVLPTPLVQPTPVAEPAPTTVAPAATTADAATTNAPAAPATSPAPAMATAPVAPPRFDAAYLNNPRPPYPPVARRLGEQGLAVLRVRVSADGLPEQVELHRSAGSPRLDEAALEAVRRWRFTPARQGDRAVAASVLVPLVFKLEN